jgi:hypothetical protein
VKVVFLLIRDKILSKHAPSAVINLLHYVYMGGVLSLNQVRRTLSF